jgi:alpha-L-rhamnosidase
MHLFTLARLSIIISLAAVPAFASVSGLPEPSPDLLKSQWAAEWITHAAAPKSEFGVYLFKKTFELSAVPSRFVVHVTGDARYRLFVNGRSVCFGPQRSDAWICHYDSVDLAPWLRPGTNVVASQVWSYGENTPYAITGLRTGFLLQGDSENSALVNTNATWQVMQDTAYVAVPVSLPTYIVVGPGLRVQGAAHPWKWQEPNNSGPGEWSEPRLLGKAAPAGWGTEIYHALTPRTIPFMEESAVRFSTVRRSDGVRPSTGFLEGRSPLVIPAHAHTSILLDQGVETNAFPQLIVSGGLGGRVRLTYAEALIDETTKQKGNRDQVDGKILVGMSDEFLPEGGDHRTYSTLEFRTYRYVQLEIETADASLRVDDLFGMFTGYPLQQRAKFSSDDPALQRVWDVGWRTARLCAGETYYDCPYYEQLQYVGDTRIQGLISLNVAGDDRLVRNAIELYDRSRIAEGLTQSRYPSVTPQLINTFSLFWIQMVHDYWMHRQDDSFIRDRLAGLQSVLGWFENRIDPSTGLLGPLKYWTFVDWTDEWAWDPKLGMGGEPDGARAGGSSIVSLQLAATLGQAAEMFRANGRGDLADHYTQMAEGLRGAVNKLCWDEKRHLYADTPQKRSYSQHANAMAVLSGAVEGSSATSLMKRVVADTSLIQCSTYFRFYLLRAMKTAGLGDEYLSQLGPWRTMLSLGLSTFAEKPDPTRSDCHAWSASPVYEFLATVCGIEPASPGFATVRIEPHLGNLQHAEGTVPHPSGEIRTAFVRQGKAGVAATLSLPNGVTGTFVWNGKSTPLTSGDQKIVIP